jgi:transcriptional regulator with XRE-family HTH domain
VGNVGDLLEAELIEGGGEAARIQGQSGVQLERRGVNACRNVPAAILELADRAGISRGLLQRIEKGNLKCEIGAVFEVATIVGVKLFDADENALTKYLRQTKEKLALMPKSVRKKSRTVHDDF